MPPDHENLTHQAGVKMVFENLVGKETQSEQNQAHR